MFAVGERVLALANVVACDGLGDLAERDPTSRNFVHACLGDEGEVVEVHQPSVKERRDHAKARMQYRAANYCVRWKRTDTVTWIDPSEVCAWLTVRVGEDLVQQYILSAGMNAVQVVPWLGGKRVSISTAAYAKDLDLDWKWAVSSTVPNEDHSGSLTKPLLVHNSLDVELFDDAEIAKRHAESILFGELHLAEESRQKANAKHEEESRAGLELQRREILLRLEKVKIEMLEAEIKRMNLELEKIELQKKLDDAKKGPPS